jgi:hypothetical protein
MEIPKILKWWLQGWNICIRWLAFYILISIILGAPIYLSNWLLAKTQISQTTIMILYLALYVPFSFKIAAIYFREFTKAK